MGGLFAAPMILRLGAASLVTRGLLRTPDGEPESALAPARAIAGNDPITQALGELERMTQRNAAPADESADGRRRRTDCRP